MKNLFLLLAFVFSTSLFSQITINDNILGTWVSDQTPFELKITKVKNHLEFIQHNTINNKTYEEIVLRQLPNTINNTIYIANPYFSLDITYRLKDEKTLVANCFGSYYGIIYYNKL
tara:strand:- start:102 stop:449 length:348 start_codon:yes stop_codon:yes gene_type:complete